MIVCKICHSSGKITLHNGSSLCLRCNDVLFRDYENVIEAIRNCGIRDWLIKEFTLTLLLKYGLEKTYLTDKIDGDPHLEKYGIFKDHGIMNSKKLKDYK